MKHKLLYCSLIAVCITLFSCHKEEDIKVSLYLSMPSSYDAALDLTPNISVWANGVENAEFVYKGTDESGRLRYEPKQPLKHNLTGSVFVLFPYSADAQLAGENILLQTAGVQKAGQQSVFMGTKNVAEGEAALVSPRMLTTKVQFTFNNIPDGVQITSVTLRLIPKTGTSSNLFHTEAHYDVAKTKMSFADAYQRTALTAYSENDLTNGSNLYLGFFPENYTNCTLQTEIIAHDNTSTGTLHVFTMDGRSFLRAQTFACPIDFAQQHITCPAYTTDADRRVSGGIPITVNNITFAPVNLGYDDLLSPFGLLFLQTDLTQGLAYTQPNPPSEYANDLGTPAVVVPSGWRLPTAEEMNTLTNATRSAGYTRGLTYGWWFGDTAADTPADGNNIYLEAAGYIDAENNAAQRLSEGRYWTSTPNTALLLSDDGAGLTTAESCACSVRLVKE